MRQTRPFALTAGTNGMSDLRLDWCSYDAAKYAVENWHYSESMPVGKTLKIGVWEDDDFIGAIIYSRGANPHIADPFGLNQSQVTELTRVALRDHDAPVSQMLSISRKLLTRKSPGLRVIVSYADKMEGHHGGIYRADNWYFLGMSNGNNHVKIDGKIMHTKSVASNYGTNDTGKLRQMGHNVRYVEEPGKFRYAYPLDDEIKPKIEAMSKPYP